MTFARPVAELNFTHKKPILLLPSRLPVRNTIKAHKYNLIWYPITSFLNVSAAVAANNNKICSRFTVKSHRMPIPSPHIWKLNYCTGFIYILLNVSSWPGDLIKHIDTDAITLTMNGAFDRMKVKMTTKTKVNYAWRWVKKDYILLGEQQICSVENEFALIDLNGIMLNMSRMYVWFYCP